MHHLDKPEVQRMILLAVREHLRDGETKYVSQGNVEFKIVKWRYGDPMDEEEAAGEAKNPGDPRR